MTGRTPGEGPRSLHPGRRKHGVERRPAGRLTSGSRREVRGNRSATGGSRKDAAHPGCVRVRGGVVTPVRALRGRSQGASCCCSRQRGEESIAHRRECDSRGILCRSSHARENTETPTAGWEDAKSGEREEKRERGRESDGEQERGMDRERSFSESLVNKHHFTKVTAEAIPTPFCRRALGERVSKCSPTRGVLSPFCCPITGGGASARPELTSIKAAAMN